MRKRCSGLMGYQDMSIPSFYRFLGNLLTHPDLSSGSIPRGPCQSFLLIGHQLPINPLSSYSASSSSSPHPFVIFHHDHAIVRHDFNMITNPQSDYKVEFPWTLSLYSLILCHDSHDPHSFLSCPMPHFLLCYPFLYMVLLFSHAFISIGKKTVRVLA